MQNEGKHLKGSEFILLEMIETREENDHNHKNILIIEDVEAQGAHF